MLPLLTAAKHPYPMKSLIKEKKTEERQADGAQERLPGSLVPLSEPNESMATGVVLEVFEDKGVKSEEDLFEEVVAEPYKLDLLALPRPPRRAQFPTHYKAPRAVMTPEERELLLGAEAASQNAAAEERPAGLMQSPRAHVASTHALPTDVAAPRSQKKRRTVDDLCQEEELRQTAAQPSQRSTPPPQEALLSVEPPALGSYKPPGAKSHRAPPNQQPPKQHREPALTPVTNATAASTRPNASIGQHGVIARKKPRRMLDDLDDGSNANQPQEGRTESGRASPQPTTYQRYPGQQRGKEDGSMLRKRQSVPDGQTQRTFPPALPPPAHPESRQAAAAAQRLGTQEGGAGGANALSPLHFEIQKFTALVTPEEDERLLVLQCLEAIRASVLELWPLASTHMFGSQAVNLAMPGSDIDICILGAIETKDINTKAAKQMTTDCLKQLKYRLKSDKILDQRRPVTLISARVPIIKCHIKVPSSTLSLKIDISLGVDNGVKAVEAILGYMRAMPPLRPLVLVAKSLVKSHRLHEVHTGGISSFSLVNLMIAHLMAEGYILTDEPEQEAARVLNRDLGHLLWGFFIRFGTVFDYYDEAVSIIQGGVIRKRPEWRVRFKAFLLAVEDPIVPGKDISSGTYQIQRVVDLFAGSAEKLTVAVEDQLRQKEESEEQLAWDKIQEEGRHRSDRRAQRFPILGSILTAE